MKSLVAKHSIMLGGHKTSVSLEARFWQALKDIASRRGQTPGELIAVIDHERTFNNLSSALRLFVLSYYQECCKATAGRTASDR
jgi:predicted DNA-binding ribbon-helix-helix protein